MITKEKQDRDDGMRTNKKSAKDFNLCDSCRNNIATCMSNVAFGCGTGNDNIVMCSEYLSMARCDSYSVKPITKEEMERLIENTLKNAKKEDTRVMAEYKLMGQYDENGKFTTLDGKRVFEVGKNLVDDDGLIWGAMDNDGSFINPVGAEAGKRLKLELIKIKGPVSKH